MRRWHQEAARISKQWRQHHRSHVESNKQQSQGYRPGQRRPGSDSFEVDCRCDDQPGRFRKRHAHDCGRARCQLCHGYKFPCRLPTWKERQADLVFQEQLNEWREAAGA